MSKTKLITLLAVGQVQHDGVTYADGDTIADVPAKQAEALLQVGAAMLPAADDATNDGQTNADAATQPADTPADDAADIADAPDAPDDEPAAKATGKATGGKAAGNKKAA